MEPVRLFSPPGFEVLQDLRCGMSCRHGPGGKPLLVSFRACPVRSLVWAHREAVARALGATLDACVFGEQVHEAGVALVGRDDLGSGAFDPSTAIAKVDALVTCDRGVFLAGLSADCPMVFFADPKTGAIALAHSSWRSTVKGVCIEAVRAMSRAFGTRPSDLVASIGPSIGPCCFEVREDFVAQAMPAFPNRPDLLECRERKMWFDLWRAIRYQLEEAGLRGEEIHLPGFCTRCEKERFFSHRREGAGCGRMMSAIGWTP